MRRLDRAIWRKQDFERNLFAILNIPIWNKHFEGSKPADCHRLLSESLAEFSKWAASEFAENPAFLKRCETIRACALEDTTQVSPDDLADIRRTLFARALDYHRKTAALVRPVHHVIVIEPVS